MSELTPQQFDDQDRLREIAQFFATQHGLRPDTIDWVEQYDGWRLVVTDAQHTVRVVFSLDEIEDFAAAGESSKGSQRKIRDAFAHLTM